MNKDIISYNSAQSEKQKTICDILAEEIMKGLPKSAEHKIWHRNPVWFLDGNPVVGYDAQKTAVRLLFWSGQTFEEEGLTKSGSFKAAEARYTDVLQIKKTILKKWLKKAKEIQWDYKNIIKRKGKLIRIV